MAVRPNPIQAICICIVIIWGRWRPWGRVQDFPKFERLHINLLKLHGNLSVIPDGRGYSFHSTWQALITRSFSVGSCSKLLSASSHVDAESSLWSAEFLFFFLILILGWRWIVEPVGQGVGSYRPAGILNHRRVQSVLVENSPSKKPKKKKPTCTTNRGRLNLVSSCPSTWMKLSP